MRIIFFIAFSIISLASYSVAEAQTKSAVWNNAYNLVLQYFWNNSNTTIGGYAGGLLNPHVSVSYYAQVQNCDTGELIIDNESVPVGSRLKFAFVPHEDTHIAWFGTGYSADSPYGHWVDNAEPPATVSCLANDFVNYSPGSGFYFVAADIFVPLNINPPEKSITQLGTAGLSAPDVQGCQVVTTPGSVTPQFNFSATYGKFYYRYFYSLLGYCAGNNYPMTVGPESPFGPSYTTPVYPPFILDVPQQAINFTLTATPAGSPPTLGITGPTVTSVEKSETYTFSGLDPDNEQITYHIDWNNDSLADAVLGPVESGVSQVASYAWPSTGVKNFQAYVRDVQGNQSAWVPYTVEVTEGLEVSCSVDPTEIDSTNAVTWTAAASGGSSPYSYAWNGSQSFSATEAVAEKSYSNSGDVPISVGASVTVTDAHGVSVTSTNCPAVTVNPISPPAEEEVEVTETEYDIILTVNKHFVRYGEEVILSWQLGGSPTCSLSGTGLGTMTITEDDSLENVRITNSAVFTLTCGSQTDTQRVIMLPRMQET